MEAYEFDDVEPNLTTYNAVIDEHLKKQYSY